MIYLDMSLQNQTRAEEITMREDCGHINLEQDDDNFGGPGAMDETDRSELREAPRGENSLQVRLSEKPKFNYLI